MVTEAELEKKHHHSHVKTYLWIFVFLGVLTIVEIWAAEQPWDKFTVGTALTVLAVVKAFLVAYYYMHLKDETRWLKFIALIPISAAGYAFFLVLESIYR